MKKIIIALLAVITMQAPAQQLLSKEGRPVLPEKNDWSIGIDATRLIRLNDFNFISPTNAITGKWMKDSATAYRMGIRVGFNTYTSKAMVEDRLAASNPVQTYPAAIPQRENVWKRSTAVFGLSGGLEKRRGDGRLQGIYGVEAGIYISSSRDRFTYANKLNASPLSPVKVDARGDAMSSSLFGSAQNVDTVPAIQNVSGYARVVDRKNGLAFSIGARLFIGAEYFFLPKMSIGGEFGWGLGYSTTGRKEITYESQGETEGVRQTTIDSGTENVFSFDTDNNNQVGGLSASLKLNLYF